jgi:hypothetical protein
MFVASSIASNNSLYNGEMANDKKLEPSPQQERLDRLRARVYAAKVAYLNRTSFEDKAEISYEDLKAIAQQFIQASYEVQKQKFGVIKVRISVAKLLRQR